MMGQGSLDGGVGGLHHLIQSSDPWSSWQEALKGWRIAAEFSDHNWAAPEAAGPVASRIGHGSLAVLWLEVDGGFLAALSRMALHGIQGSTLSKSNYALQWKDEWSIPREWKGVMWQGWCCSCPIQMCVWEGSWKFHEKSSSGNASLHQAITTVWKRILCKDLAS